MELGIHIISPLQGPWDQQLALIKRGRFSVGKVLISGSAATAPENVEQLIDVLVPGANGRKTIILRTDDALRPWSKQQRNAVDELRFEFVERGFKALVEKRDDVDWYLEVLNEPDHAGLSISQTLTMLRDAIRLKGEFGPRVSWIASLPTTIEGATACIKSGATDGYEALGCHLYGDYNLGDGGYDWPDILALCLAQDRAVWITEAGINDHATAKATKAQRILSWMEQHTARRLVGLCVFVEGQNTAWPQYEIDATAADVYAARGKESHMPALRQGVDRAGGIAVWEAQGLKSLGFDWCGVYIGGPTNGGYGWSRKVVDALGDAVGWRFMPIYVGQNTDWTPVSKLNQAQGVIDGTQAAQLMQQFGWMPNQRLVVALDVEYNTNAQHLSKAVEYMVSWCNTVTQQGYLPAIYSHAFALNAYAAVAQVPTYAWLTAWIGSGKLANPDLKHGLTTQFTDYAIQYTGGTWLQGQSTNFDLNAATDTFPLNPAPAQVGDVAKEQATVATSVHFEETGHGIGGGNFQYWSHYGGLKIFGYPLTDEFDINDTDDDGKPVTRTVQVFERAVFERHPGKAPNDWDIMLRRVGADVQASIEALKAV